MFARRIAMMLAASGVVLMGIIVGVTPAASASASASACYSYQDAAYRGFTWYDSASRTYLDVEMFLDKGVTSSGSYCGYMHDWVCITPMTNAYDVAYSNYWMDSNGNVFGNHYKYKYAGQGQPVCDTGANYPARNGGYMTVVLYTISGGVVPFNLGWQP
jgi:hypothetical protein